MKLLRQAGRAFGRVNMAVAKATTSKKKWRAETEQRRINDPDFSDAQNVANLRAKKDGASYDLLLDDNSIHVGYQSKQGKTHWRKAADVGGHLTAVNPGSPPGEKDLHRRWSRTYKDSGGTYSGMDAQIKYLNDLGYTVEALDKRPLKAWRAGSKQADHYVAEALNTGGLSGKADHYGPYIDPNQAHSTADKAYRREFFRPFDPESRQQKRGKEFDGYKWRRPPQNPPQPPPATGPTPTPGPGKGPNPGAGPAPTSQPKPGMSADAEYILKVIRERQAGGMGGAKKPPDPSQNQGPKDQTGQEFAESMRATVAKHAGTARPSKPFSTPWTSATQNKTPVTPDEVLAEIQSQPEPPKSSVPATIGEVPFDLEAHYKRTDAREKRVEADSLKSLLETERRKNAAPDLENLDNLTPEEQAATSRQIEQRGAATNNLAMAREGVVPDQGRQDIGNYLKTQFTDEQGNVLVQGDERMSGADVLAAIFSQAAKDKDTPEAVAKIFNKDASRLANMHNSLAKQKQIIEEKGPNFQRNADKEANQFYETFDPQKLRPELPVTATDFPSGLTDAEKLAIGNATGQFATNPKDVKGVHTVEVPTAGPIVPGYINPTTFAKENLNAIAEQNRNKLVSLDVGTDELKIGHKLKDPQADIGTVSDATESNLLQAEADSWVEQHGKKPDSVDSLLDQLRRYQEQNLDDYYGMQVATRLAKMTGQNDALTYMQSDIKPASTQENRAFTDAEGRQQVEGNTVYTTRTAATRQNNAADYVENSSSQNYTSWRKFIRQNLHPELAKIDRSLPLAQQKEQARRLADQTIEEILINHARSYRDPENTPLMGPVNIFTSDFRKKFGAKLGLDPDDQNIDMSPEIENVLEKVKRLGGTRGLDEYFLPGTSSESINSARDMPVLASALVTQGQDKAKAQQELDQSTQAWIADPKNPALQNMANAAIQNARVQGIKYDGPDPSVEGGWQRDAIDTIAANQLAAPQQALEGPKTPETPIETIIGDVSQPVASRKGLRRSTQAPVAEVAPEPVVVPAEVLADYPELAAPQQPEPAQGFSLKSDASFVPGRGLDTGILFQTEGTALDNAAAAGQYTLMEGQGSLLDQVVAENAQALPPQPIAQPATVTKPTQKITPNSEKLAMYPILEYVLGIGGIKSLSQAGKYAGGEYDFLRENKGMVKGLWGKVLSRSSGNAPDQMHQALINRGLMSPDSTVNDMWDQLASSILQYKTTELPEVAQAKHARQQAKSEDQINKFSKEIANPAKLTRNHEEVYGAELQVGDKFQGEKQSEFEVTDVDPDTGEITLQDGPRYGTAIINPDDKVYVRKWRKTPRSTDPGASSNQYTPF